MEKVGSGYMDSRVIEHIRSSVPKGEMFVDKTAKVSDDELIRIRKEKVIGFFKSNYNWVAYVVLAIITYMAFKIRTSNLGGLRDITTNTWTLGPDLDPFLFLRWAKHIVETGSLMVVDTMRYVPNGFNTKQELILHPYLIAWFHKVASLFGSESVTHSAVLFPAYMFALTVIAFFFMTRKVFLERMGGRDANIIALIASFFLSVIPALLPRTIAGIPEKESAAFLFLFLTFFFFLSSWKSKKYFSRYFYALLAGVSTAAMALVWGGYIFIFLSLPPAVFIAFLLGKVNRQRMYLFGVFLLSSFTIMHRYSIRYSIKDLFSSLETGLSVTIFFIILLHFILYDTKLKNTFKLNRFSKIPPRVISTILAVIILLIVASILFGSSFAPNKVSSLVNNLIRPSANRLLLTVAENRQPYFTEWSGSFGPHFRGIPVTFWLFFVGSVYLFIHMVDVLRKKERFYLTLSYLFLLIAVIFSRYSPSSNLNGENFVSLALYFSGPIVFIALIGFYYYKYYMADEFDKFKKIDFSFILIFSLYFLSIIAARAAVRTIMVLVPTVSILVAYLIVVSFVDSGKVKNSTLKIIAWILVALIIIGALFAGFSFYKTSQAQSRAQVPSIYAQQWQKAMAFVRTDTPETAVFGHWWDYGYWVQSIGERATVLDGGNAVSYWNHLMGRYALTGPDERDALEFLYAHNTTHFLIDSTDIGKYGAFSSIGSDANYDRASFIPTFQRNDQAVRETKNTTINFYQGGAGLDEDIIYDDNGTKLFLPSGAAGIGGVLIERDSDGKMLQPNGLFVYQGQQYSLPLRYGFDGELHDFGSGVESGFFLFPRAVDSGGGVNIDPDGALLYLSARTVKSQLARLYLYNDNNSNFKLVHSEDDFFVSQIKSQNPDFDSDFIFFRGLRGPIRIWEIDYPDDIELKEEYLSTYYPEELLSAR